MSTATVPVPPELATLSIEIDGEIGTLTLDRPDALNAMSPEMIGELTIASAWLADRAPLRALIVTGAGDRAFSLGRRRQLVQGRASTTPSSTCPPTCAAAPRSCTRRSSTSAASPIR